MTTYKTAIIKLSLEITVRVAVHTDIPKMEWFGQYRHYRHLLHRAFNEQEKGNRLILVADLNDFPIGYLLLQFKGRNLRIADGKARAYLYSFRVMEPFRSLGIGTRLIYEAEKTIQRRGFQRITIAVGKDNNRALGLYKRLGYQKFGEDPGRWKYTDDQGTTRHVEEPCWLLQKLLDR